MGSFGHWARRAPCIPQGGEFSSILLSSLSETKWNRVANLLHYITDIFLPPENPHNSIWILQIVWKLCYLCGLLLLTRPSATLDLTLNMFYSLKCINFQTVYFKNVIHQPNPPAKYATLSMSTRWRHDENKTQWLTSTVDDIMLIEPIQVSFCKLLLEPLE